MPSDAPPTTREFEERAEWVWRVLGIRLTAGDRTNAVVAEALVARFERLAAAQAPLLQTLAQFPAWNGGPNLRDAIKARDADLSAIERDLAAIDATVTARAEDLTGRMDAIEQSQAEALQALAGVADRQARLREDLAALQRNVAATAAPHRGDVRTRLDELAGEIEAMAAPNVARGGVDQAGAQIPNFANRLTTEQVDIARQFQAVQDGFATEAARIGTLAPITVAEDPDDLEALRGNVDRTLNANDLVGAAEALAALKQRLDDIERERAEALVLEDRYNRLKPVLEKIAALADDDFSDEANARAIVAIQERITESLATFDQDQAEHGWVYVGDEIGRLDLLLEQANERLENDEAAGAAIQAATQQAAAAALLAQQQAAAAAALAQQQAATAYANNVLLATTQADGVFGAPALIDRVWRKTKQEGPNGGNTGIGGAYPYGEVMAAIDAWHGQQFAAGFMRCHVPGNGSIQDKRPKGRNEVQANFISDWGPHGQVDVHVNLRPEDWHMVI